MKKKDNRGMSLVELIIVIALISVIVGASGYGLSLISNKPVEECTKKVEIILNRNRTNSMGKKDAWVEFYTNSDGLVTYVEHLDSASEPVVIGDKGVKLCITYSTGSVLLDGTNDTHCTVAFSRDSGAVRDRGDGFGFCKKIEIYKGDYDSAGNNKTIELEKLTGKVTIK